jgi:predicted enzyme related to lactoylglutathione lyase
VTGVGGFSWHELATSDWSAALQFYQRLFAWETAEAVDMGPEAGTYQMFGRAGKPVGGMFKMTPQSPRAHWLPYIRTVDARQTAGRATKLRGQILTGPMQVPGGDWVFVGADLQGAAFAVHSGKPPAPARRPASKARKVKAAGRVKRVKKARKASRGRVVKRAAKPVRKARKRARRR